MSPTCVSESARGWGQRTPPTGFSGEHAAEEGATGGLDCCVLTCNHHADTRPELVRQRLLVVGITSEGFDEAR
jgi:hypothetical protein